MTDRPVLTGARWSNATRCPRMAALDALGAIPAAPSDRVSGLFERGHDVEEAYFRRLGERYSGTVEREKAIAWGAGWELHCDAVLPDAPDRPHIEVKSTVKVDELPGIPVTVAGVDTTSAVLQVVGAAHFDPEGGTAELVTVSPVDYYERTWPINITPELRGAVEAVSAYVMRAAETGTLPDRVCGKPSDAIGRFCPHRDACFSAAPEWHEPEPVTLDDERAFDLVERLLALEAEMRTFTDGVALAKMARDDARRETADALALQPGTEYMVGQTRLKITSVKGRETFAYRDAVAAGHLTLDQSLTPYVKTGQPSTRWVVEAVEEDDE